MAATIIGGNSISFEPVLYPKMEEMGLADSSSA